MKKALPLHQLSVKYNLNEVKSIIIWLFKKAFALFCYGFSTNSKHLTVKIQ